MEAKLQRQQTLSDARRTLVLDAARAVFAEVGVSGANIREIAKRAGYTPGAIYSYFDSKEAIYAALLADLFIIAGIIHDWRTRGRPHPAYLIAGGAVLIQQLLRAPVSTTAVWDRIAV